MSHSHKKPSYGYEVKHLVFGGIAAGCLALTGGAALVHFSGSSWTWLLGIAGIVAGTAVLALSSMFRWFVVHGRPRITERMLDAVPWTGDEKVLDVGCGPGLALIKAAKRLKVGQAIGIDPWLVIHGERANRKDITLENAEIEGVADRVRVVDGNAASIPFDDNQFDVVMSSFVFHHLPNDVFWKAIREMVRVAKPGGRLLIADEGRIARAVGPLQKAGMIDVSLKTLIFPVRLLKAQKPKVK